MSKLANNTVIFRKEDFPGSPEWWNRAIFSLNRLTDYVSSLTSSINALSTNVSAIPTIISFNFTQTSDPASTTNPENNTYTFQNSESISPSQLLIYATNSSFPIFTSPVWASWHVQNGFIYIDAITGLANSTQYTFTVTLIY